MSLYVNYVTRQMVMKNEVASITAPVSCFNPLAYTDVPETAGLARSINP